ncbi:hypothetical protein TVAG_359740 [Trichomonas vaginalis G3]|uniref:Myb-like domain-containing protein n=1 Tax=Trichomonas vaginalis (strain ATCC PRA-98 / G3) TaxID=412133 RepID=A2DT93_TRIV3|nr:hypothetical protein TVAGG3_0968300 [Trichomonas vaginalis G3]EAY16365.1 hypothetical protein TVAG_359740 [Trichomonas vaginalis G3]KAI5488405.1 hypothetical protein TVAGG3_0968300 [Trichomonas vaginalis G3]|eukprot:XP_001328588.1 hypothetical protein [Trichomonas vaginalis G3]
MASIEELLNRKVPFATYPKEEPRELPPPIPTPKQDTSVTFDDQSNTNTKSAPYTLSDDLSIFNVIVKYYGDGFHGKIPWSFWQTYKRVSGSTRSNSSLYHHWNGSMKKKYESFITTGRLSECIAWLETAIQAERAPMPPIGDMLPHTGMPLMHMRSQPAVPLVPLVPTVVQIEHPSPLIRNASFAAPFQFYQM